MAEIGVWLLFPGRHQETKKSVAKMANRKVVYTLSKISIKKTTFRFCNATYFGPLGSPLTFSVFCGVALTVARENAGRPPDHLVRLVIPDALRVLSLQEVLRRPVVKTIAEVLEGYS